MKFRPCIDIHDGKVKQIVGATLSDLDNNAKGPAENFVAENGADYYASMYKKDGLSGGHIIILNKAGTDEYEATKSAAFSALKAYPNGMQIGGGINADNASEFIEAGASHVIVTSYVFNNGRVDYEALDRIKKAVGKKHLCLDLSCKKSGDDYYIVTDRWQKMTEEKITLSFLHELAAYCDEFLIHAADVEGKRGGIERGLVSLLAEFDEIPVTYAGGVGEYDDIQLIKELSNEKLDFTIGSALDIFGGKLSYTKIVSMTN